MRILYAASVCSESAYERLFADTGMKPAFQAQKYHHLFIEGLASHTAVDVVCYPPANRSVMSGNVIALEDETVGGANYHYLRVYRNPVRKLMHVLLGTFFQTMKRLEPDTAVVVDVLHQTAAFGALMAAKIRGNRCVAIITDLPEYMGGGPMMALSNFVIRHCTDYVVLTEAMNTYVNPTGKPHVVLEGHADITMREKHPDLGKKKAPRIVLYAGSIHEIYGIKHLVEGFRLAALPNTQLHIYGAGDYLAELQKIAELDPSVVYGGMLLPNQVVDKEMEATLLVNPRPTDEPYVKYSFPSKTMEYMSTGTPVLTTALPGLPGEYYPHVYLIREESAEGIAEALRQTLSASDTELFQKGNDAREFILRERNNVIQAGKVLAMLEGKSE